MCLEGSLISSCLYLFFTQSLLLLCPVNIQYFSLFFFKERAFSIWSVCKRDWRSVLWHATCEWRRRWWLMTLNIVWWRMADGRDEVVRWVVELTELTCCHDSSFWKKMKIMQIHIAQINIPIKFLRTNSKMEFQKADKLYQHTLPIRTRYNTLCTAWKVRWFFAGKGTEMFLKIFNS